LFSSYSGCRPKNEEYIDREAPLALGIQILLSANLRYKRIYRLDGFQAVRETGASLIALGSLSRLLRYIIMAAGFLFFFTQ
jgi:hypothetical protein